MSGHFAEIISERAGIVMLSAELGDGCIQHENIEIGYNGTANFRTFRHGNDYPSRRAC